MSQNLEILIIENSATDIEIYEDAILNLNKEFRDEFKIIPSIVKSKEDGHAALKDKDWVAAFVDLKLSSENILAAEEGNELVREIFQKLRFPVTILSNTPQEISQEFEKSVFLKVYEKSAVNYQDLLKDSIRLYKTGVIEILGGKGLINEYVNEIFWNHLSHTLDFWVSQEESLPNEELKKILLRYTLSHLQENLFRNEVGDFEKHHPSEFYIFPPINEEVFTGDIITFNDQKYIILNPACDMVIRNYSDYKSNGNPAQRNSSFVLLCKLVTLDSVLSGPVINDKNAISGKAKDIVQNKKSRYHFLPPYYELKGYVIDFQDITTKLCNEVESDGEIFATVSSIFLKDIIARFSFYYSRQGAPDMDFGHIERAILEIYDSGKK